MEFLKEGPVERVAREFWAFNAGACCASSERREELSKLPAGICSIAGWQNFIEALRVGNGKGVWEEAGEHFGLTRHLGETVAEAALVAAKEYKLKRVVSHEVTKLITDKKWMMQPADDMGRDLLKIVHVLTDEDKREEATNA